MQDKKTSVSISSQTLMVILTVAAKINWVGLIRSAGLTYAAVMAAMLDVSPKTPVWLMNAVAALAALGTVIGFFETTYKSVTAASAATAVIAADVPAAIAAVNE